MEMQLRSRIAKWRLAFAEYMSRRVEAPRRMRRLHSCAAQQTRWALNCLLEFDSGVSFWPPMGWVKENIPGHYFIPESNSSGQLNDAEWITVEAIDLGESRAGYGTDSAQTSTRRPGLSLDEPMAQGESFTKRVVEVR